MTRPRDAIRSAVRRSLADLPPAGGPGAPVLVACSGGPDSLALAAAAGEVARASGIGAGAVIVDHALQTGSAAVAERAAAQCRGLGLAPVTVLRVEVGRGAGPEAAARSARYEALARAATGAGAAAVLLAHTLDDQAETVLLGLARGSGARSLQGMPAVADLPGAPGVRLLRPLLGLSRDVVHRGCASWGLEPWTDPHNSDAAYTRSRVRDSALPALVAALGPGVPAALARTAALLRDDEAVLAQLSQQAAGELGDAPACAGLAAHPAAVRRRVLRALALRAGCPPAELGSVHLLALDALAVAARDGGDVRLPGGVRARISCGTLVLAAAPDAPQE